MFTPLAVAAAMHAAIFALRVFATNCACVSVIVNQPNTWVPSISNLPCD